MGFVSVMKKDFRVMMNSKLSILIMVFGPLFLMGIMGAALQNTQLRDVTASIFAHREGGGEFLEGDWYVDSYADALRNSAFVVRTTGSLSQCKQDVLDSESNVCIEIIKKHPVELDELGLTGDFNYETQAYVDFSKSRIVWGVIGKTQAASEGHSRLIVQNMFIQYQDTLEEPVEGLRDARERVDLAVNLLNQMDSELDSLDSQYSEVVGAYNGLDVALLRLRVNQLVGLINGLQGLDPALYDAAAQLEIAFNDFDDDLGVLDNEINGGSFRTSIQRAREVVGQTRRSLLDLEDNIEDFLDVWDEIEDLNYEEIAPMGFSYKSVDEADLKGSVSGRKLEFLDYLFPSFLMFFIIFVSLVFSTVMTFKERSSRAHIRNVTSRTSSFSLVFGNFISLFFLLILQICVILAVSMFFLRASILTNILPLMLYSVVGVMLFSLGGVALGYMFNSQDGAVIASVSLSLLFLIFLPVITAPETLPPVFSWIISGMPFVVLEGKLRMATIFNLFSLPSIPEIISLGFSFILSIVLITYFYQKRKRFEI